MVKRVFKTVFILSFLGLIGCAHVQKPIQMDSSYLSSNNGKIGVAIAKAPEAGFQPLGNIGLLDFAIISGATGELTDHLKTLNPKDFVRVKDTAIKVLTQKGIKTVSIKEEIDLSKLPDTSGKDGFAARDFASIKKKYGITSLLLLRLSSYGIKRNYYGFIPTTEPNSYASIEGQLIDLTTNALKWHYAEKLEDSIAQPWDEPEAKFPNVTNSVYHTIEKSSFAIKQSLIKG